MEKADYKACFGSDLDFLTVLRQLSTCVPFPEIFALFQVGYCIFIEDYCKKQS